MTFHDVKPVGQTPKRSENYPTVSIVCTIVGIISIYQYMTERNKEILSAVLPFQTRFGHFGAGCDIIIM